MAVAAADVALNVPAPEFRLPATDGKTYELKDVAGPNGTVIVFICNHCPYVKAVSTASSRTRGLWGREGIGFAAICANDAATYPDNSFDAMKAFAERHAFSFPYLHDESQLGRARLWRALHA